MDNKPRLIDKDKLIELLTERYDRAYGWYCDSSGNNPASHGYAAIYHERQSILNIVKDFEEEVQP